MSDVEEIAPPTTRAKAATPRDKRKQRRFERIKAAARELFLRDGYQATTLREIAKKARVSAATIVVHFGDKDELVALLYNEDQKVVTEQAYLELSESKDFLDQSIDGFRHYYRYFALYPNFIRAILQTTSLYHPTSMPSRPAGESAMRSVTRIKRTVEIARKRGEITIEEADDALAFLIFGVYLTEIRWWLGSGNLDVELGLARLRHGLGILLRGLSPGKRLSFVDVTAATSISNRRT
jgi:TetR/AcrR family transcriptional regulator, cholesterol catabolism regulator